MADDNKTLTTEEMLQAIRDAANKVKESGSLNADQLQELFKQELTTVLKDYLHPDILSRIEGTTVAQAIEDMAEAIAKFYKDDSQSHSSKAQILFDNIYYWADLEPYLMAEIEKPEYNGLSLDDLMGAGYDSNNNIVPDSLWDKAVKAAEHNYSQGLIPVVNIKRAEIIEYPLDKVNNEIWDLLKKDTGGQLKFPVEKRGSDRPLNIYYSIDFEDLKGITITKQLLPFDKRVYMAISALFNAGNRVISLTQIHYAIGNTSRPSGNQLQKIYDSIYKMTRARVYINNDEEVEANYNYPCYRYDGSLLPLESLQAVINGQLSDAAIRIFREPPVITFAKERKQISTISISLLASDISKTDANIAIDDYLIERILRAKNADKEVEKILFKTLYEKANITTTKQKQRAPEKIERYLTYYRKQKFIKSFLIEKDSVVVCL